MKKKTNWYTSAFRLLLMAFIVSAPASAFIFAVAYGMSCIYYYIPIAVAVSMALIYLDDFLSKVSMKEKVKWTARGTALVMVVLFVIVAMGSCVGSLSSGGGNRTQQRIEMGLPLY